ncbi:hypothetical protein [Coleofasciculus sp. H7-2]
MKIQSGKHAPDFLKFYAKKPTTFLQRCKTAIYPVQTYQCQLPPATDI